MQLPCSLSPPDEERKGWMVDRGVEITRRRRCRNFLFFESFEVGGDDEITLEADVILILIPFP